MAELTLSLRDVEPMYLRQLEYAIAFASDSVKTHRIDSESGTVHVELFPDADEDATREKLLQLIERYRRTEFGLKSHVYFEQHPEVQVVDAWRELLQRRLITVVGDGHVVLRGLAARLHGMIDAVVLRDFATPFDAETEVFPATILSATLDRCNHFTAFPEHVDFVAHLKPDVDVLGEFAEACRTGPWHAGLHDGRMSVHDFAISPSCCYHCYEGMQDWDVTPPGRCVTAILNCHRYEGANQGTLRRLRSFHQREVIWVGHPKFVLEARELADTKLVELARRWGLNCSLEIANDMFFTDDYAVKASFQRQQAAKKELRALIPQEKEEISVISSNFHSTTFGKAFNIRVNGRAAASACLGWGLERIVYAVLSQFGFDPASWPDGLQEDFQHFSATRTGR